MPVSSATSRTAACSAVSPASMWPLGSDHSSRPRRSVRPISAPTRARPDEVDDQSAGADVSSTRRTRGRRGRAMPSIVSVGRHSYRTAGRPAVWRRDRPADRLGWTVVSTSVSSAGDPVTSPADLVPVPEAADRLGEVFAAAGHELHLVGGTGPRRAAAAGSATTSTSPPTPARAGAASCVARLGRRPGRPASSSARSARWSAACAARSPPTGPTRTTGSAATRVVAYGDSLADDLRRRDFTMNAMAVSRARARRSPTRTAGCATWPRGVLRTPADPRGVVRRRPAADAAGGPVRLAARLHRRPPDVVAAMTAMAAELGRITAERVQVELTKLLLGAAPAPRAASCWSTPGWPTWSCPSCRRCGWRSTSTTSTRTSTRTP